MGFFIRRVRGFPKQGISFNDISSLLKKHWKETVEGMDLLILENPGY